SPEKPPAVEIEVLREHVEDGDEDGKLDEEAGETPQRIERMHARLAIEREGATRALLPPMGGGDGVETGLKTGLGGIDLLLQALRDLGKGKEQELDADGEGDDGQPMIADDRREPAQEIEQAEAQRAEPEPEPGQEQAAQLRVGGGQSAGLHGP